MVKRRAVYLCVLGGISLLLIALSVAANAELVPASLRPLRRYFNLAHENNLAAWWSGSLLLVAALHALDGRAKLSGLGDRRTAAAWAALALVLIALSLDEVGSLHERAERFVPLEGWWALLPFGVVLLGVAGWSAWQLWERHRPRSDVALIAVAFALFGSVAFQEELEHALVWPAWALPIRLGMEEGTELAAMLLLIVATSACSGGIFARHPADSTAPVFAASRSLAAWPLVALPILAVPLFALGSMQFTDVNRGHPADWLAATLFLLAALSAWSSWLEGERFSQRDMAAGTLCVCASAVAVQLGSEQTTFFGTLIVNDRLAALACLLVALAGVWTAATPGKLTLTRGLIALGAVALACLAAANPGRFVVYAASGYAAVLVLLSLVHRPAVAWLDTRSRLKKPA